MAAIWSKIGFSRNPNTKVYNLNPAVSDFSSKKLFYADLELELNRKHTRASHASANNQLNHGSHKSTFMPYSEMASGRKKHKNDFWKSASLEYQSVKVVENYSVDKEEATTQRINGCLKVAEEMRDGASRLLVNLHQQSEQITQTHQTAATIDHVLQRVRNYSSFT